MLQSNDSHQNIRQFAIIKKSLIPIASIKLLFIYFNHKKKLYKRTFIYQEPIYHDPKYQRVAQQNH